MRGCLTGIGLGVGAAITAALAYLLWLAPQEGSPAASPRTVPPSRMARSVSVPAGAVPAFSPPPPRASAACAAAPQFRDAAAANGLSRASTEWLAFGRDSGWETYAPLVAREIGTACDPGSEGFAAALAAWQKAHGLKSTGVMDMGTFEALRVTWIRRRPFVQAMRLGCPDAPGPEALAPASAKETYGGKTILLRPAAWEAWRRMVAAARAEEPALRADPNLLKPISGWRDPLEDEARCRDGTDCGLARAPCSAHRTGLALDLYLGAAPGHDPASSAAVNRLWQSRTPAYRWLVNNADRFGFVAYPYEPWHWEWTGEAVGTRFAPHPERKPGEPRRPDFTATTRPDKPAAPPLRGGPERPKPASRHD
jgi:hypothetical protein